MSKLTRSIAFVKWVTVAAAFAVLTGCGGDDSDGPCVNDPKRDPLLPSCEGTGSPGGQVQSGLTLTLSDSSGNATSTVSPTNPGFVEAKVKDSNGKAASNAAVSFTTTDSTGGFSPPSASALTDSNGIARVTLIAGSVVGAYTLGASTPGTGSNTVNGAGTVGSVPSSSATLGYAVNVSNLPTSALGSIKFVSADPKSIALKGTGGVGRQEFSLVTFQVFDQTGHPVQRTQVNFTLNTSVGGLALQPQSALTDANGKVSTVVSAGTVPTPAVIVTASAPASGITTVSNLLVISTGLAIDSRTSLSVVTGNCEGWNFDGECTQVTLRTGDHFGNPVVDGTAVSFSTEYGIIDAACVTGGLGGSTTSIVSGGPGECTARLNSAGNRPPGGRLTVLAYLRGEEDFFDANGNNVCDGCSNTAGVEFKSVHDLKPDVIRDDSEDGRWTPGEPCISPSGNPGCDTPPDGIYNGVLANPKIPDALQTIYLSRQYVSIWSGSNAYISPAQALACASFSPPGTGSANIHVRVVDVNGNPMPAGTKIVFSGPSIAAGAPTNFTVANYVVGVGQRFGNGVGQIPIEEYDIPVSCSGGGTIQVTVTTPRGIVTSMTIPIK